MRVHWYGHAADFSLRKERRTPCRAYNILTYKFTSSSRGIRLRAESRYDDSFEWKKSVYTRVSAQSVIQLRAGSWTTLYIVGRVEVYKCACVHVCASRHTRSGVGGGGGINVSTVGREWPRIIGSNLVICKVGETGFANFSPARSECSKILSSVSI